MSENPPASEPLSAIVQRLLDRDPYLASEPVEARSHGGRVRLVGEVSRSELRDRATALAVTVPGVREVSNELDVH